MDDRGEWLLKLLAEERHAVLQVLDLKHTTLIAAFRDHYAQEVTPHPLVVSGDLQDLKVAKSHDHLHLLTVSENSGVTVTHLRSRNSRKSQRLKNFFDSIDANGNGEISLEEVRAALEKAGQRPAQARRLLAEMEALCMTNGGRRKGSISRDDWMRVVEAHSHIGGEISQLAKRIESSHVGRSSSYILSFDSHFRLLWDVLCSICVLYVMIFVPYWLGFDEENGSAVITQTPRVMIGQTIDIIFLIDILLNFRTSYQSYGQEVRDWRKVTLHYVRSWFLIDAVSSVPVSFVYDSTSQEASLKLIKFCKALAMLKLLRSAKAFHVLSMSQVGEFVEHFIAEQGLRIATKLFSIAIALVLCCHWLACSMATVSPGIAELAEDEKTGRSISKYMALVYWALTTVTTVGYGDLVPRKDSECLIAMIAMCVGGTLYSLSGGIVTSTIVAYDRAGMERAYKMDIVDQWLHRHPFPTTLKRRLRHYFKVYLHHETNPTREELDIFEHLTGDLRSEVARVLIPDEVREVPIFKCLGKTTIGFLVSTLQRVTFMEKEVVLRAGECGVAMFVIIEGHCLKTTLTNHGDVDSLEIVADLFAGESFGEEIILNLEEEYGYTVVAQQKSKLCSIEENLFMRFMRSLPQHLENMRDCYQQSKWCEGAPLRQSRAANV